MTRRLAVIISTISFLGCNESPVALPFPSQGDYATLADDTSVTLSVAHQIYNLSTLLGSQRPDPSDLPYAVLPQEFQCPRLTITQVTEATVTIVASYGTGECCSHISEGLWSGEFSFAVTRGGGGFAFDGVFDVARQTSRISGRVSGEHIRTELGGVCFIAM